MAKPTIATTPQGAVLSTEHVGRRMKAYPITETEMDHVSFMNTLATGAFSAAASFLALMGGILTNAAFVVAGQVPPEGKVLLSAGVPLLIALSALFAVGGILALRSKNSTWKKIKAESEQRVP